RHAVIKYRLDKVYIENVSPTGQILKAGDPIEYAELEEGHEVHMGPYTISWRLLDDHITAPGLSSLTVSPKEEAPLHPEDEMADVGMESAPEEDAAFQPLEPLNPIVAMSSE